MEVLSGAPGGPAAAQSRVLEKIVLLNVETSQSIKKGYLLWKKQGYRDREQISDCHGLG